MRARALVLLVVVVATLAPATRAAEGEPLSRVVTTLALQADGGVMLSETITYDASYYRGAWSRAYAPGFVVTSVHDEDGNVPFEADPNQAGAVTFRANEGHEGLRSVTIEATRGPMDGLAPGVSLVQAVAAPATSRSSVTLVVMPPEGGMLLAADGSEYARYVEDSGGLIERWLVGADPTSVMLVRKGHYAVLAPLAWRGMPTMERALQATQDASDAFPMIRQLTGLDSPQERYLLVFAPDEWFGWADGSYRHGIIHYRQSLLTTSGVWRLVTARGIVHETTHAFLNPVLSRAGVAGSWLDEGTSVRAEIMYENTYPQLVRRCEAWSACMNESARMSLQTLHDHYEAGSSFSPSWTPNDDQSTSQREFAYAYSGFLVGAYVQQYGPTALHHALQSLSAHPPSSENATCQACPARTIEDALLQATPDASSESLYQPYASTYHADKTTFDALVSSLVVTQRDTNDWALPGGTTISLPGPRASVLLVPLSLATGMALGALAWALLNRRERH